MQHSSHPQEMADAVAWLQQRLPQPLPTEAELRAMSNSELKRLAGSRCGSSTCTHARAVALLQQGDCFGGGCVHHAVF
jgi:hypothetical protein